jgi:hypothetical protein
MLLWNVKFKFTILMTTFHSSLHCCPTVVCSIIWSAECRNSGTLTEAVAVGLLYVHTSSVQCFSTSCTVNFFYGPTALFSDTSVFVFISSVYIYLYLIQPSIHVEMYGWCFELFRFACMESSWKGWLFQFFIFVIPFVLMLIHLHNISKQL